MGAARAVKAALEKDVAVAFDRTMFEFGRTACDKDVELTNPRAARRAEDIPPLSKRLLTAALP